MNTTENSIIDICVNLTDKQFAPDREAIIERARQAGVCGMLVVATNMSASKQAVTLCGTADLKCTVGIHPHDSAAAEKDWLTQMAAIAKHPQVAAIGETGLDFNRNFSPPEIQIEIFAKQIEFAQSIDKPLLVHDRDSAGKVASLLQQAGQLPPTVIHCFTGNRQELETYLAAGYYIGITGWVTEAERGAELRNLIPHIPLSQLLIETDAPYLKPKNTPSEFMQTHALKSRLKRRNEPALLPYVLAAISELREETPQNIAAVTTQNAQRVFGFQGQ